MQELTMSEIEQVSGAAGGEGVNTTSTDSDYEKPPGRDIPFDKNEL